MTDPRFPPETVERIKARRYECFMEGHDPSPWTSGQCAGYAGRGALAQHLFRCKRRDGYGLGGLFCKQHAGDRDRLDRELAYHSEAKAKAKAREAGLREALGPFAKFADAMASTDRFHCSDDTLVHEVNEDGPYAALTRRDFRRARAAIAQAAPAGATDMSEIARLRERNESLASQVAEERSARRLYQEEHLSLRAEIANLEKRLKGINIILAKHGPWHPLDRVAAFAQANPPLP